MSILYLMSCGCLYIKGIHLFVKFYVWSCLHYFLIYLFKVFGICSHILYSFLISVICVLFGFFGQFCWIFNKFIDLFKVLALYVIDFYYFSVFNKFHWFLFSSLFPSLHLLWGLFCSYTRFLGVEGLDYKFETFNLF